MSDEDYAMDDDFAGESRYAHLRVNVPRRRSAYVAFIIVALTVFALSLVDIIWLDEVAFWGVVGAYVLLFILGLLLLIAFRVKETEFGEAAFEFGEAAMHCPNCDSVFMYAVDHPKDPHGASMTCPVCSVSSRLPAARSDPDSVVMPKGKPYKSAYRCDHCREHFVLTTLGKPQQPVKFDECPNCHKQGSIRASSVPATSTTTPIKDWQSA